MARPTPTDTLATICDRCHVTHDLTAAAARCVVAGVVRYALRCPGCGHTQVWTAGSARTRAHRRVLRRVEAELDAALVASGGFAALAADT